eukprot:4927043-Prymnesium_polylepis.1
MSTASSRSVSLDDFELGRVLGRGAFATVGERSTLLGVECIALHPAACPAGGETAQTLSTRPLAPCAHAAVVVKKDTRKQYALKSLNKQELVALRQVEATKTEHEIPTSRRQFVVRMHWAFESAHYVHFVLDYMPGDDLYRRMQEAGPMPLDVARLFTAEITLALGHLHAAGLVYHLSLIHI